MRTIVWFRDNDLRLADHAPLRDALDCGEAIPLFVLDPSLFAPDRAREMPQRMQFLLDSLRALATSIAERGSRLAVVSGRSVDVVPRLCREWKADRVVAHGSVDPRARDRDRRVGDALGSTFQLFEGETLLPRGALRTRAARPYTVFGQFARAFRECAPIGRPLPPPSFMPPLPRDVRWRSAPVPTGDDLGIVRNPAILSGGEAAAQARLRRFLRDAVEAYGVNRDRMDLAGTSRLSVDLRHGTLSARQIWADVAGAPGAPPFLDELSWREFAHSTLWDRPELLQTPFRPAFAGFPWSGNESGWRAWVRGETGYPVVDAAARQLLSEGFVHNRARMVSASFLAKHLLVDYRRGEAHYLRHLADGDAANNDMGWQWSAGCGCDAQPWFRIFNPVIQGEKFDPNGDYVRRWVPELARMPAKFIHRPWEAPEVVLREAGVRLDGNHPRPIVEHRFARERFLDVAARHVMRKSGRKPGRFDERGELEEIADDDVRGPGPRMGPPHERAGEPKLARHR